MIVPNIRENCVLTPVCSYGTRLSVYLYRVH